MYFQSVPKVTAHRKATHIKGKSDNSQDEAESEAELEKIDKYDLVINHKSINDVL